jgi:hypothetical protein
MPYGYAKCRIHEPDKQKESEKRIDVLVQQS